MQKVFRRTVLAERQVARRAARRREKNEKDDRKTEREQKFYNDRERSELLKQAAKNRREDWELGPLAPRRDVGEWKEKHGTITPQTLRGPKLFGREKEAILQVFGGNRLNIAAGDRVVLLEGRDKGKIGTIKEIDTSRGECTVEGLNMVDVAIPKWMVNPEDPDQRPIRTIEKPVSLPTIRLVHPLMDEKTGTVKDVIIKKLAVGDTWHNMYGELQWSRIIPGLKIEIPWPPKETPVYEATPSDTLRIHVETKTYVPTLLIPPMPHSVIDELRNKFSVFRTRHEPEYIAQKEAEERAKEDKKKSIKRMSTPLRQLNRKLKKWRNTKRALTPEMMEKIGEAMAQRKQLIREAGIVSNEEPAAKPTVAAA